MPTVFAIRHVAFEDLGAFAPVFEDLGYRIDLIDAGICDFEALDPSQADVVVILGGPIGAYEEARYPFLHAELHFIERCLQTQRPVMGICLGAQLLARALGARVYPGGYKEIGFAPIRLSEAGRASCLAPFGNAPLTLHWHGDTFDLPREAQLLASTDLCSNQSFAIGPRIIGFQFHPEAGGPGFERWLIGHAVELVSAGIDVATLRADAKLHAGDLTRKARTVLTRWLDGLENIS